MNAADNTNAETKETIDATIGNGLLFEELEPNEKVNIQCFSYTEEGWSQNGVTDGVPDPVSDSSTPYSVANAPILSFSMDLCHFHWISIAERANTMASRH